MLQRHRILTQLCIGCSCAPLAVFAYAERWLLLERLALRRVVLRTVSGGQAINAVMAAPSGDALIFSTVPPKPKP